MRLYGADHERITITALLRSTREGRHSALRGGGEAGLLPDVSGTQVLLDGVPLQKRPTNRNFAPRVHFWLAADRMFQGVDSERGITWRANDLLARGQFLRIGLGELRQRREKLPRSFVHLLGRVAYNGRACDREE